jgi:hypothetical protein
MRLPFCRWIIVIVTFVTMATGVTAFSFRVRQAHKEICLVRRNRHAFSRNVTLIDQTLWTSSPHQAQI